ncbi:MAG TPA: hypothetical protein VFR28_08780, partial [Allosphingosinicella sp.]|nr:hypothetical protein [Allosphingosinicella sp.]
MQRGIIMGIGSRGFCFLLGLAALDPSPATAQQFEFGNGREVMTGDPVEIRLTGLPPGAEVEIRSERVLTSRFERNSPVRTYRAAARFR